MFQPATWPPASPGERPIPKNVRIFLAASERRVLSHCRKLLERDSLPADERQRLLRLATAADQEIKRLADLTGIRAA